MFDHEVPIVISAMHNLTVGLFKRLEISSILDVDKVNKHTKHVIRGESINKHRQVLVECNDLSNYLSGYHWNMVSAKSVTMEQFWNWCKVNAINGAGDIFTGPEHCP